MLQLRTLVAPHAAVAPVRELLERLGLLIDSISSREETSVRHDLVALEELCDRLKDRLTKGKDSKAPVLHALLDATNSALISMKGKIEPANEIQFTVRPVNTVFFLEEKSAGLEFIILLSVSELSIPIHSLVVEARLDRSQTSKLKGYISMPLSKVELGSLDPGVIRDAVFRLSIDPTILSEYSEAQIELLCFDGSREVKPSDKKRIFNISFRTKRRGFKGNPFIAGPAIEKGSLFVGREQELVKIKDILIGRSQDNIPLVLGMRRIGKTSLLKRLMDDDEIKRLYVPIFYDLQDMVESETASQFLKKLCSRIHEGCGEKWKIFFSRSAFDEDAFDAFDRYLMNFEAAPGTKKVLVVFDEFEKFVANLAKWQRVLAKTALVDPMSALVPEVLAALRKAMLHAKRISFIIAGLPEIKSSFQEYESRWFGLMTPIIIKPLDREEAKRLIQPPEVPYTVSLEAMDEIIYMTGCQPYLIQLVCKNLFTYMMDTGRQTVAQQDVERVIQREILPNESYFSDYFKLIGNDRRILKAIALVHKKLGRSRRYVPIDSVLDLLNLAGEQFTRDALAAKLSEMEKSERPLLERSPNRSDAYRIVIGMLSRLLEDTI
jgi:AAA+ ATPase superfamily predicted ATPase